MQKAAALCLSICHLRAWLTPDLCTLQIRGIPLSLNNKREYLKWNHELVIGKLQLVAKLS